MIEILNINERISYIIDNQYNGNQKKFAENIGFSAQVISNIVSGRKSKPSYEVLNAIVSTNVYINSEWLLTGKGDMLKQDFICDKEPKTDYIPLIPIEAMAGKGNNGSVQILQKDIIGGYVIPEFTQRGVEYIIRVSGSSMYPKYSSGDLLGCKTVNDTSFFQWGKIYVLDTDQGPMVKRLFPTDKENILECRSDNKDYPPFPINKDSIYKIAIVIGVLRLE